jgi:hypothetical protein
MINSLLLLKYNKHFCEDFCAEILELELRKSFTTRFSDSNAKQEGMGRKVPASFRDPSHFGSLGYLYCEFKETSVN